MWIKRLTSEVQRGGLWDSPAAVNRARPCDIARHPNWENPARITSRNPIQISLNFINELLSFKNSETIGAGAASSVNEGLRRPVMWTGCGRGCGFVIHGPRETSDS